MSSGAGLEAAAEKTASSDSSRTRLALVFNGLLASLLGLVWLNMARQNMFWRADFSSYYLGWSLVLDGRGAQLYDRQLQADYQKRIVPERGAEGALLPFNNPPHFTIPFALLALLPRDAAFYTWDIIQLALLAPVFRFLRRLLPDCPRLPFSLVVVTVLAFPPLFMTFQMGQVSLLILLCLLGFVCNLQSGRPFWTAFWLVLSTIKPQLAVVPAAILIGGRRWRELSIAAVLLASWFALTTSLLGWSCWSDYAAQLAYVARQFGTHGIHPLRMYNFKGFLTAVLDGASIEAINFGAAIALFLTVLTTMILWRKSGRHGEAESDLRLALCLQLGLIFNPHFNGADALVLIVPALLFYRGLSRSGRPTALLAALLAACPLLFLLDCYLLNEAAPAGIRPFFLLMAALALAIFGNRRFVC